MSEPLRRGRAKPARCRVEHQESSMSVALRLGDSGGAIRPRVGIALAIVAVALLALSLRLWAPGVGLMAQPTPAPATLPAPTTPLWLPRVSVAEPEAETPIYGYRVIAEFPHDPNAFTQGLLYHDGLLYESTGLYGASSLRRVELETGRVLQQVDLPANYFGEGLALWGERLIQLTWQENTGFFYDRETFQLLDQFSYPGEGWGLTHDGQRLIMSDGTAELRFWDPDTLEEIGRVTVRDHQRPVNLLNELEYVRGEVYANVWMSDRIARIDPTSGQVVAWIDLAGLLSEADRQGRVDVLNGIAYDAEADRMLVTGKWWPKVFHIELVPPEAP
jgi:glutaminyl-peptide cyclotransferase